MPNSGAEEEEEEEEEDRGRTGRNVTYKRERQCHLQTVHSKRSFSFTHLIPFFPTDRMPESSFYRNKTAAELCEKWLNRRAVVKLAYKHS